MLKRSAGVAGLFLLLAVFAGQKPMFDISLLLWSRLASGCI
jgi:hypothetical protein